MKKTDLIRVIREIVRQELKKELPIALAQVFTQMMGQTPGRSQNASQTPSLPAPQIKSSPIPSEEPIDEMSSLKTQLREMFNGEGSVQRNSQPKPQAQVVPVKKFTSNPILNEVLNQTRPFNSNERMANRVGGGGAAAMMSPGVAMAASHFTPATTGAGELMSPEELGFLNKVPGMPGAEGPVLTELPAHVQPTLREGQEGGPAPMEGLAVDSALDLKNHPALPDSIKGILSRDYRALVRAMDKKK